MDFGNLRESWNQSPTDTEKQLYMRDKLIFFFKLQLFVFLWLITKPNLNWYTKTNPVRKNSKLILFPYATKLNTEKFRQYILG